ncbi:MULTISPECIES: hypothetical protein [Stenotrophomonas maltophilia group]|uniref:hypothetical protein n=1 Tax=Stenotrophomonas maltophilia group TaxID=995085 RepID=UPI001CA79853|nr:MULTISPECIES: hypothetical protein [Stenotrophomonas maltophilia group]MBY8927280.1 hypothetical protein [Stenotrophomonas maltophilia]HDS1191332.1 hypothetical protein [Stenotrophomonas maltophilia]HEL3870522.1 hypothetical protein [Stenotrophomonas maltophilia]
MKRLTALATDPAYLDRYIEIRNRKHLKVRRPLIAAQEFVEERYEVLADSVADNTLSEVTIDARSTPLKAILRACYDVSTGPLRDLKKAIVAAQSARLRKYCPMCGTTLHSTFDHYLPAVKFPEFAVHPLNLVPCCSKCNSTKDDDWLSAGGGRQYLHAYSDEIPDRQFVTVDLHEQHGLAGVGATFSLVKPCDVDTEIWELIKSHFDRLHLIDRYDEQGNDEIAEILADCRTHIETGGPDARAFLAGLANDRRSVYGRNHWRAVLMEALSTHENFETWLQIP